MISRTETKVSTESNTRRAASLRGGRLIAGVALVLSVPLLLGSSGSMPGDVTPAPEGARLEIISPMDGDTVSSPVLVKFGLGGMGVAPAGVSNPNTGHHHLIVDAPLPNVEFAIPKDANHRHFGGGQTQVSISLSPGKHTLQLLLGDYRHIPHVPPLSSKIVTITVK